MLEEFRKLVNSVVNRKDNPKRKPLDAQGNYYGSPVPLAPPLGYQQQPSLSERIREMVRSERLAQEAREAGFETLEEADDFEIGDDYDPRSPFEYDFDPPSPSPSPSPSGSSSAAAAGAPAPVGGGGRPAEPVPGSPSASSPAAATSPPDAPR